MTQTSTASPAPPLLVDLGDRWTLPHANPRYVRGMVVVAVLLHLLPFTPLTMRERRVGEDALDGVAVELIDAAELDRRFPTPGAAAPPPPPPVDASQPAPPPQPAAAPAAPPAPPATATDSAVTAAELDKILTTPLPSTFEMPLPAQIKLPPQPRLADLPPLSSKPAMQESPAERYLTRRSKSPQVATGEVDAFTTAVARALERVKPIAPGVGGRLVISFVVTPGGRMEDLRLVESSGAKALDDLVLRAATKADLPVPPSTATPRDRTFEIIYTFR